MTAESLDTLRVLRDRIASLRVIRCRMIHERVRVEDGAVVRISRGGAEPVVARVGLCAPEERARNLACGHTMARYLLLDAISALHGTGWLPDDAHHALADELGSVSNAIHLLDHRKGDAERTLALSADGEGQAEVKRMEAEHDAYAERLQALQRDVLERLDAALLM